MSIILLVLSIVTASVRGILSKGISGLAFGTNRFFEAQAMIFACGCIAPILMSGNVFKSVSLLTVVYGLIYSVLLLMAQCCYTMALSKGNVGICSTVYSLGFILPTVSGSIFWNEVLTVFDVVGILLVIPAIILSGGKKKEKTEERGFVVPLVIAMLASGGLGIMQKIQQSSPYPDERSFFVIFAFAAASVISYVFSLFAKKSEQKSEAKKLIAAGGTGIAFGISNLLNTILAGRLDSAVFFPVLNVGTILFSGLLGIVIYKDRLSKKDVAVIALGIMSIVFITVL